MRAYSWTTRGCGRIAGSACLAFLLVLFQQARHPALAQSPAKAVVLSINDIYQVQGINNGRTGGMARVRALRAELEKTAPDLLFLHAGDFLSPSFPGRIYKGAHMIDVMNVMDGNARPGSFDARMFVAFGNHEFDDTNCNKNGPLAQLVEASEFMWIASNLVFSKCGHLSALARSPRIAANRIVESGGLKIGLFSLTLPYPEYAAIVLDPLAVACSQVADLRARGADAVVALTHLSWTVDREVLGLDEDWKELPAARRKCAHAPDIVIGGHDHQSMGLPSGAPRLFKADAEAATAWVVEIEKVDGKLRIGSRLVELDEKRVQDALVQRVADHWLRLHDERFCLRTCVGLPADKAGACLRDVDKGACLETRYAKAASELDTEEIRNRSFETGFGNWVADRMRSAGRADVAFLNAGSIRINESLPAGTILTRRHLEQMFPFSNKLVVRAVSGAELWAAMQHAVGKRGEGAWAHTSGMAVKLADGGGAERIERILVRRWNGSIVEIDAASTSRFTVASIPFVLADGDGHGFKACPATTGREACMRQLEASPNWPATGERVDLAGLVRGELRALDPQRGLELAIDRRLCERGLANCLIAAWGEEKAAPGRR